MYKGRRQAQTPPQVNTSANASANSSTTRRAPKSDAFINLELRCNAHADTARCQSIALHDRGDLRVLDYLVFVEGVLHEGGQLVAVKRDAGAEVGGVVARALVVGLFG